MENRFCDHAAISLAVSEGRHREVIGGLWDEIGRHQFDFMVSRGLKPHHRLLDFGCGSLRGGVHFVRYLDPSHYFGCDINQSLLDAGYDREIVPAGLSEKLPRNNLMCGADGDGLSNFGVKFDCALALSLFTHMTFNNIRVCLERLAPVMKPQGRFFATFFELPSGHVSCDPFNSGRAITYGDQDPYHYRPTDMCEAAATSPWQAKYIGDFGHARGQMMMAYARTN